MAQACARKYPTVPITHELPAAARTVLWGELQVPPHLITLKECPQKRVSRCLLHLARASNPHLQASKYFKSLISEEHVVPQVEPSPSY